MFYKNLILMYFFAIFIISTDSFANANNKTFNSDLIKKEIQEKGAEEFISSHGYSADIDLWGFVESKIESGDSDWVHIGFELLKKSDAGITWELLMSLGQALNKNPVKVLYELKNLKHDVEKQIEADFRDKICGSTLNEYNDEPGYIPSSDLKEIIKRKNRIEKISDPNLFSIKKECVRSINQSIEAYQKLIFKIKDKEITKACHKHG